MLDFFIPVLLCKQYCFIISIIVLYIKSNLLSISASPYYKLKLHICDISPFAPLICFPTLMKQNYFLFKQPLIVEKIFSRINSINEHTKNIPIAVKIICGIRTTVS